MPFRWTYLIADTDPCDLFDDWADPNQDRAAEIERFQRIMQSKLSESPSVEVKLWSDIQRNFESLYKYNFEGVLKGTIKIPNIETILRERYDYYKRFYTDYFEERKMKVTEEEIDTLATIPPKRNIALYAGQGPICEDAFDCIAIADRDPLRCGKNQSVLTPNMGIIYPFPGK